MSIFSFAGSSQFFLLSYPFLTGRARNPMYTLFCPPNNSVLFVSLHLPRGGGGGGGGGGGLLQNFYDGVGVRAEL